MSAKSQSGTKTELELKKPSMYAVNLHNDDYTTMDFVVEVLMKIFHKSNQEATAIMIAVHEKGHSLVDVFTYDIASTKKMQTDQMSLERGFPLQVTIDEVEGL